MFKMIKNRLINMNNINYVYIADENYWENRERPALTIVFGYKDELSIVCEDINEAEEIMKQLLGDNNG